MLMTNLRDKAVDLPTVRGLGTAAVLVLLSACAHKPATPPPSVPVTKSTAQASAPARPMVQQIVPTRSPRQRYDMAVELLQQGNSAQARTELAALLQQRPGDRRAGQLLREIDTDPRVLYGSDSFAYVVRSGDTLSSLARRYLRDPASFYGLARFNNLTFPTELRPGQTLMIPGRVRSPERAVAPPRRPSPVATQAAPAKPEEAARPAPKTIDRGRAQRLRQQGLEQMSAGSIDRAVQLLSQAAAADPTSGAIAGELARARRVQATVRGQ